MPKAQITKTLPSPAVRLQELTSIPPGVREHFAALGRNVVLSSADPKYAVQMATISMDMVLAEDLPPEVLKDLKRNHFQVTPDGQLRRADATLYSQSEQARAYWEEQATLQALRNAGKAIEGERAVYEGVNRSVGQNIFGVDDAKFISGRIPLPG